MTNPLPFNGGLTLSIPVSSLDTAIAWYQKHLGFELIYRMDELGWCELTSSVEHVNIGLSVVEEPNVGGITPTFGVSDLDVSQATLLDQGVRTDGDVMVIEGMVKLLTIYDADDNALMLYEELQSQTSDKG